MVQEIIINEGSFADVSTAPPRSRYGVLTFGDMIDHLIEYGLARGSDSSQQLLRDCVQQAYLDIINATDWGLMTTQGGIYGHAPQTTGTITYTHSTRLCTLSGATWPTWITDAVVRVPTSSEGVGVDCDVDAKISDTAIRFAEGRNPGDDVAAGSTYTAYCQWYPFPSDCKALLGFLDYGLWDTATRITMTEFMRLTNLAFTTSSIQYYCIAKRPNRVSEKALFVYPFFAADRRSDIVYERRPQELIHTGLDAWDSQGAVSLVEGDVAVAGTGTAFRYTMEGCALRIGDAGTWPTGRAGLSPYREQHVIRSVLDATNLELYGAPVDGWTNANYSISDVIGLEACVTPALKRFAELHLANAKGWENLREYQDRADRALLDAMAGASSTRTDGVSRMCRVAGVPVDYTVNLSGA